MNAEFIRSLLRRQPFEPFRVIMSHGESYVVKHLENALLAGSRLIIHIPESDGLGICSLLHINDVKMDDFAELDK